MAEVTLLTTVKHYNVSNIRVFPLSAVVTGSTLTLGDGVAHWWINNRTTTDAVTATLSGSALTITVANTPDLDVFVVTN